MEILLPYYASTMYESLFLGNFVDRVQSFDLSKWSPNFWNPLRLVKAMEEYRIYCTLGWTMHTISKLFKGHNVSQSVSYHLTLFMDMHIPLMIFIEDSKRAKDQFLLTDFGDGAPIQKHMPGIDKVFHQGNLPDVLHYIVQCSFFNDSRSKTNPIVHLLSKSLPQRCTIRNLREIVSNYCRVHNDVYDFVIGCLKCSLLGLYETCADRPPLDVRIRLIRKFNHISKVQMLQWMMRDHQQLLFYTIKEFLIYGVRQIPSIYEEIKQRYYWDMFETCVTKAMNTVRKCVCMEENMMDFKGIETQLSVINKQQVHHLFRPTRHLFCHVVVTECEKIDDSKFVDYLSKEFPIEHRHIMYQMAIRTPGVQDIPYEWLQYFNVKEETIKKISHIQDVYIQEGSKTALKGFLNSLCRYEFEAVRDFSEVFDMKMNVRIFTLPAHLYVQQHRALRRKYSIPDGVPLPKDVGNTLLCLQCKQFKAFVNHNDGKGKISNLYAFGHGKILVDDCTMKMYCGKRCDKVDAKKRHLNMPEYSSFMDVETEHLIQQNTDRNMKRAAKEKRKELKNHRCASTELCSINMVGVILQFYNNMYALCPICANFMQVTSKYFTKDGMYCGCCIQHGRLYTSVSCEWCKAVRGNETWSPISVIDDTTDEKRERNIYLCQSCHKPWIRNSNAQLCLSVIHKGLSERWKRLQHAGSN